MALYQPQHEALTPLYGGSNPKVRSLDQTALALWCLGYPEQALARNHEALQLVQELGEPSSLMDTLLYAALLHVERREGRVAQERAEATVALSSEYGFSFGLAMETVLRGAALIAQAQWAEGMTQVRQGLEAYVRAYFMTGYLAWLAAGCGGAEQVEEGLAAIAEALRLVKKNDERFYEAEVYRIKGELLLQKAERGREEDDKH